jgi:hypothetical protein
MHSRPISAWIVLSLILLPALSPPAGAGPDPSALVYYQVTGADGEVRDQFSPPTTNVKIVSVVRISRYDSPSRQGTLTSTESGVTRYNAPKLVRADMQWDGNAWVVPAPAGSAKDRQDPEAAVARAILTEARRINAELRQARARLASLQVDLQDAEVLAAQVRGSQAEPAAQRQLERTRTRHQQAGRQVKQLQAALEALIGADGGLDEPTGRTGLGALDGRGLAGIARPIDQTRILPHRVQVWPLARASGRRSLRVSMAHPEAGPGGAFCYVAYADTDGDGKPDTRIGRSKMVSVSQAGAWSWWDLETDAEAVFVGNAWPGAQTPVYCRKLTEADRPGNWTGLGSEVWVSGFFGADPDRKFWPYLSNIRVRRIDGPIRRADHRLRDR